MAVRERQGRPAVSNWRVLESFSNNISYMEVEIETGRTHQIRVHLASIGHPIAGDSLYGKSNRSLNEQLAVTRQCLHSYRLAFFHPQSGEQMSVIAPVWSDMQQTLDLLRELSLQ